MKAGKLTPQDLRVLRELKEKLESQHETMGCEFIQPSDIDDFIEADHEHWSSVDEYLVATSKDLWGIDLEPYDDEVDQNFDLIMARGGVTEDEANRKAYEMATRQMEQRRDVVSGWIDDAREAAAKVPVGRRRRRSERL